MNSKLIFILLLSISLFSAKINAQNYSEDEIVGVWLTGTGKGHVQIFKAGNYYYGKIVWLKEPLNPEGKPKMDKNNPDKTKNTLPLLGLINLSGFEYKGDNLWENGTIYDPEAGKTYSCKMTLKDKSHLNIRGFVGISAFGRTDVWTRQETKKK